MGEKVLDAPTSFLKAEHVECRSSGLLKKWDLESSNSKRGCVPSRQTRSRDGIKISPSITEHFWWDMIPKQHFEENGSGEVWSRRKLDASPHHSIW